MQRQEEWKKDTGKDVGNKGNKEERKGNERRNERGRKYVRGEGWRNEELNE